MKHLIMGTAGHVDHGKTALIKTLTGINCDTHPEEKKRGITMNLGFSSLNLDDEIQIGIVDVPGHKDFVHTMVGGAFGIDFVLLVVSADSGIMPQTREHVKIMEILGVKKGIIVLNKIDLVDEELLEMSKEEIKDFVVGTFLEDAPVKEISALTGAGVDDLKNCIKEISQTIEEKVKGEIFRLYIDRIFSVSGFGTVVTGTVVGGTLNIKDKVYLLPENKTKLRIRRMEQHGKEVDEINAGDRASINLVGLNRSDFERGMLIADRILEPTEIVDVKLSTFDNIAELKLWSHIIFLCGTNEIQGKLHLLDTDTLKGGETAVAQIRLSKPAVIFNEDCFVIRNTSSDTTLGGGVILDAHPLHHKRRTEKMIEQVTQIVTGDLKNLIAAEVLKKYTFITSQEIADNLNIAKSDVLKVIDEGLSQEIYAFTYEQVTVLLLRKEYERIKERILIRVKGYHRRNPYDNKGMSLVQILSIFSFAPNSLGETLLKHLLEQLKDAKLVANIEKTWTLYGHKVELDNNMLNKIKWLGDYLKKWEMQTPLMSKMLIDAKLEGIGEDILKQILYYLTQKKEIYEIEHNFIHGSIVDSCRKSLLNALIENKEGITVADFRTLVGGNRKICLLLLGQYDSEKIVERNNDIRVITEKGKLIQGQ